MTFPSDPIQHKEWSPSPKPWQIEMTLDFDQIPPGVLHLLIDCPRDWPHDMVCCSHNIVLGEE